MKTPCSFYVLLLVATSAYQLAAEPGPPTPPSEKKLPSKNETMTVTIDGRAVTPEEQAALKGWIKPILSEAFARAINEGLQEMFKQLEVTDPMEATLLLVPNELEIPDKPGLLSVFLIRPGKEIKEPRTTMFSREGTILIRFTRATALVERPLAIMSYTSTKDGRQTQTESMLVYGRDGKWKSYRQVESKKNAK